jgi:hypothetical protein
MSTVGLMPGWSPMMRGARRFCGDGGYVASRTGRLHRSALSDDDERTYAQLVDRYTPLMLRVARGYVPSHQIAGDVVQRPGSGC